MDRKHRLEAIQEGKYLSLRSNVSVADDANAACERPFVIPEHDPEGSIYKSRYSQYLASMDSLSQLTYSSSNITNGTAEQHNVKGTTVPPLRIVTPALHHKNEAPGLPITPANPPPYSSPQRRPLRSATMGKRTALRISRLSITPSMIDAPPTQSYPDHFDIVTQQPRKISPMHIVKLPNQSNADLAPPDGGTLAWLQVLAGFFVVMNAQGLNQSYGVFQAYYERTLLPAHSPSTIAWIGSLQIFLLFSMSIVVSGQIDAGRFQHCFTGGSALLVAATVATSFCTRYWHFVLAQGVATGMGMGLLFGAGVQVLFTYFRRRLGIATGIASAGGAVGGMVFPAVCESLMGKVGFAWTVRVVALIVLVTLIPANLMARERRRRRRTAKKEKKKKKPSMDWSAFTDAPYLLVTAGLFCSFWGVYFGFYFIVTYAQETLHLSASEATNLLILMNAANLPGRFLPPLISDTCLGPLNTLIPCTFLTSTLLFLWLGAETPTSIHLLACLYGFAAAGIQSLYNAAVWGVVRVPLCLLPTSTVSAKAKERVREIEGEADFATGYEEEEEEEKEEEGKGLLFDEGKARLRLAMVFVVIGFACLTGAPLGGVLLGSDRGGRSWVGAQVFAGTSVAVGGALLVGARWAKEGWGSGRI